MESSAVREAAQESSPTKRQLGEDDDDALIEKAEAKKMKLEAEVRKEAETEAETEAEAKKMKVEAEVRNESFINGLGEEKDNHKEADKNDNDKEAEKAKVLSDTSFNNSNSNSNPRDSNNSNSNPRDSNFTSEIFKIEIHGLPRHTGYGQLKKFLLKLGLESKKV